VENIQHLILSDYYDKVGFGNSVLHMIEVKQRIYGGYCKK